MQDLNRRNTEIVEQAIKIIYKKLQDQQIRIDGLNAAISSLIEKLNSLEKMIILQKVRLTGAGPTVKE